LSDVFLSNYTKEPEKTIALAARLCYSSTNIQEINIDDDSVHTFIKKLTDIGHLSPFEHANFTFGIECSRACSHQLVRHRIASHCLSGDTTLKSYSSKKRYGTKQWTIEQLYNWSLDVKRKGRLKLINLRSMDEKNKILTSGKIKNILYTGKQKLYEVKTRCGRTIKSTLNELFFTENGWKKLKELSVGDYIYANGIPSIINHEWLKEMYLDKNISRKELSKIMEISDSKLGKIIRKFNLQKPKSQYPNRHGGYGKKEMFTTEGKEKLRLSKLGNKNPAWKGNNILKSSGNLRAYKKYKTNICDTCLSKENLERHHIDGNTLNNDENNILIVCQTCHRGHHVGQGIKTIFKTPITYIKYIGIDNTYDIEMEGPNFNFSANGLIVHNSQKSQRYVKEKQFEYYIPPSIKNSKFSSQYNSLMENIQLLYNEMEEIPNEDRRFILPNACKTQLFVTMNARELIHFFSVRCCQRAQWEIRDIARKMLYLVKEVAPNIFYNAGPGCVKGNCPEGKMTCGKANEIREITKNKLKEEIKKIIENE
jgi:thymidylate synthase ThyX